MEEKEVVKYICCFLTDLEITRELSDEEYGRLHRACLHYARGEEVHLPGVERILFPVFQERIDRFKENYKETCHKRSEAGKKGGRPKKEETTEKPVETIEKQEETVENEALSTDFSGAEIEENQLISEKATESKKTNCFFEKANESKKSHTETESETESETETKNNIIPLYPPMGDADSAESAGRSRRADMRKESDIRFNRFWEAYPKKKSKPQAKKAWDKLKVDESMLETILNAVETQKKSWEWQKEDGQFIPYPATWLNGRRWEDEMQPEGGVNDGKTGVQSWNGIEFRSVIEGL